MNSSIKQLIILKSPNTAPLFLKTCLTLFYFSGDFAPQTSRDVSDRHEPGLENRVLPKVARCSAQTPHRQELPAGLGQLCPARMSVGTKLRSPVTFLVFSLSVRVCCGCLNVSR